MKAIFRKEWRVWMYLGLKALDKPILINLGKYKARTFDKAVEKALKDKEWDPKYKTYPFHTENFMLPEYSYVVDELSIEDKIKVLSKVKNTYEGDYLCREIARAIMIMGLMDSNLYAYMPFSISEESSIERYLYQCVYSYIPEMMLIRPGGVVDRDIQGWFGLCITTIACLRREKALDKLLKIVKKKK
jgi:hypothetical protein